MSGFEPSLAFLAELARHNDREWFSANKARYEADVLEPAIALVAKLGARLAAVYPNYEAIPTRTRGSIMRIYRDTRFSKDRTPYKTNLGVHIRHREKASGAPGLYVHVEPGASFLGVGIWRPDSKVLASLRQAIDERQGEYVEARDERGFRRQFELSGDSLKRPPRGFPADHPLVEDLKKKDHCAMRALTDAEVASPGLPDKAARAFSAAAPYVGFLCRALGVEP